MVNSKETVIIEQEITHIKVNLSQGRKAEKENWKFLVIKAFMKVNLKMI